MKFGLRDFFLGIIHIFVIFIPGGILLGVILYFVNSLGIHIIPGKLETMHWLVFFVGSFIIGHLVSYLGSRMEDASDYLKGDVKPEFRAMTTSIVRSKLVDGLTPEGKIRRWAQALPRREDPPSFGEIERNDADRRFFRNLRVIVPISLLLLSATAVINAVTYFYPTITKTPHGPQVGIPVNATEPIFPIAAIVLVAIALILSVVVNGKLIWRYRTNQAKKPFPTYFKIKADSTKTDPKTAKNVMTHDDLGKVRIGRRFIIKFMLLAIGFVILHFIEMFIGYVFEKSAIRLNIY
jgi:hypothetical protein